MTALLRTPEWLKPTLAAAALATAGCQPNLTVIDTSCTLFEPIEYSSSRDSPRTIAAIKAHNSKYVCRCRGDCPPK